MVSDSVIRWRLRLRSSLEEVFRLLVTDDGRGRFWARTKQTGDAIDFHFPNGYRCRESILRCDTLRRFELTYFGGRAVFELDSSDGATVLTLSHHDVAQSDWIETHAGWVSVLLILKAAADHGVDLRNHSPEATWDQGFVDQ